MGNIAEVDGYRGLVFRVQHTPETFSRHRPRVFYVATGNPRKLGFLRHCLQGDTVVEVPHKEDKVHYDFKTPRATVSYKLGIGVAYAGVFALNNPDIDSTAVVAADTMVFVPRQNNHGQTEYIGLKKPKTQDELQENFVNLTSQAQQSTRPHYVLISTSGKRDFASHREQFEEHGTTVTFNPLLLEYFATNTGINDYVHGFREFYKSIQYAAGDFSPYDVAGGLTIEYLHARRAVEAIDTVPYNSTIFPRVFENATFRAAAGIEPKILRSYNPNVKSVASTWAVTSLLIERALQYME